MTRLPEWRERLEEEVQRARTRTFQYGSWDCVHFAAGCIDAMTGSHWLGDLPAYRSHLGAWRHLFREGGLSRALTARLGVPRSVSDSSDGDACLVRWYASRPVGIRYREAILVPDHRYGLAEVSLALGTLSWSV